MKIWRFLCFLALPAKYLHQAYVYQSDCPDGNLSVEFVISDCKYAADVPAKPFAWVVALWQAAG